MLSKLIIEGGIALLLTTGLIWLLRSPARMVGLLDHPDARKQHDGKVPLIGGLAMCLAFSFSALILASEDAGLLTYVLMGGYMLMMAGLVDDLREISVTLRFTLQIAAVLIIAVTSGRNLHSLGDLFGSGDVTLGRMALPFTVFAVIGVINAINMADGLDGLAGGMSMIALFCFSLVAAAAGQVVELQALVILAGCVAGFLLFNLRTPLRSRASVFMGDSGSMFLGFLLAWFAVRLSQPPVDALSPISAVWILGLPILDTVYIMLSRILRGQSPFKSGRDHLHYRLIDSGMSVQRTVWVLLAASACLGGLGMLSHSLGWNESTLFYLFLMIAGGYSAFRFYLDRTTTQLAKVAS